MYPITPLLLASWRGSEIIKDDSGMIILEAPRHYLLVAVRLRRMFPYKKKSWVGLDPTTTANEITREILA